MYLNFTLITFCCSYFWFSESALNVSVFTFCNIVPYIIWSNNMFYFLNLTRTHFYNSEHKERPAQCKWSVQQNFEFHLSSFQTFSIIVFAVKPRNFHWSHCDWCVQVITMCVCVSNNDRFKFKHKDIKYEVILTKKVKKHGHDSFLCHRQLWASSVLECSTVCLQPCCYLSLLLCHTINTSNHSHSLGEAREWVTHMLPLEKAGDRIVQDVVSRKRNYTKGPEGSSFHLILPISRVLHSHHFFHLPSGSVLTQTNSDTAGCFYVCCWERIKNRLNTCQNIFLSKPTAKKLCSTTGDLPPLLVQWQSAPKVLKSHVISTTIFICLFDILTKLCDD